tara:strand:+ start:3197 stop:3418 length:222 start_codon:yes stop_codon:yes gene_type:complete
MSIKNIFLFLIFYFFVFTGESFAYFDPGTGAFIVQAILGFIAAIIASFTMTWTRIKLFFEKIFKKKKIIKKNK